MPHKVVLAKNRNFTVMGYTLKKGFAFKTYEAPFIAPFDKLFDIFKELIVHTSGDFDEAIDWLRQLDKEYKLTDENYTIDDFIEDLKQKGYIKEEVKPDGTGGMAITSKTEREIRQAALDQIFGKLKRSGTGNHNMPAMVMSRRVNLEPTTLAIR